MKNSLKIFIASFLPALIEKVASFSGEYKQPWVNISGGIPRNIRGTEYRGFNVLALLLLSEFLNYQHPIFLTFKQAKEYGLSKIGRAHV